MNERDEFFTIRHDRLLAVAVWAKYLAWLALIISILAPIGLYIQKQNEFNYFSRFDSGLALDFIDMLARDPSYAISLIIELLNTALRGIISFLVLKGISLGLNMIIETDLNYREKEQGGVQ